MSATFATNEEAAEATALGLGRIALAVRTAAACEPAPFRPEAAEATALVGRRFDESDGKYMFAAYYASLVSSFSPQQERLDSVDGLLYTSDAADE